MNTKLLWISVLGLIGGAASSQLPIPQAVPFYEITDLGVLPGDDASFAVDLNSIGQIICISERSILVGEDWLTKYETFLWFGGRATDIGTPPGHTDIVPVAINQRGRILVNSVDDVYSTFIWKDGSFIDLGSLPGSIASYGGGISNFDEVAGYSILSDDTAVPWIWDNGSLQQLVGGVGEAFDIDDYPTVFGNIDVGNGPELSRWQNGQWQSQHLIVDGRVRVTTLGTVAGTALDPTGNWNGFVLSDSNLVWLPALPGDTTCDAADINLWGLAVGRSNNLAVSWLNGQITDLNTKIDPTGGWTLTEATAVNDRGQIIGNGIHNGNRRAFLLTPKLSPTD